MLLKFLLAMAVLVMVILVIVTIRMPLAIAEKQDSALHRLLHATRRISTVVEESSATGTAEVVSSVETGAESIVAKLDEAIAKLPPPPDSPMPTARRTLLAEVQRDFSFSTTVVSGNLVEAPVIPGDYQVDVSVAFSDVDSGSPSSLSVGPAAADVYAVVDGQQALYYSRFFAATSSSGSLVEVPDIAPVGVAGTITFLIYGITYA